MHTETHTHTPTDPIWLETAEKISNTVNRQQHWHTVTDGLEERGEVRAKIELYKSYRVWNHIVAFFSNLGDAILLGGANRQRLLSGHGLRKGRDHTLCLFQVRRARTCLTGSFCLFKLWKHPTFKCHLIANFRGYFVIPWYSASQKYTLKLCTFISPFIAIYHLIDQHKVVNCFKVEGKGFKKKNILYK